MSDKRLLPCPFCGGEAEITINKTRQGQTSVVRCTKCTCRKTLLKYPFYEGDIYADAVKDWNTRKLMQNIVERLEEYEDEAKQLGVSGMLADMLEVVKEEGEINE